MSRKEGVDHSRTPPFVFRSRILCRTLTHKQDLETGALGPTASGPPWQHPLAVEKEAIPQEPSPFWLKVTWLSHKTRTKQSRQAPRCLPGSGGPCTAAATRPHFDSPCHAHATAAAARVAGCPTLARCRLGRSGSTSAGRDPGSARSWRPHLLPSLEWIVVKLCKWEEREGGREAEAEIGRVCRGQPAQRPRVRHPSTGRPRPM